MGHLVSEIPKHDNIYIYSLTSGDRLRYIRSAMEMLPNADESHAVSLP